MQRLLSLLALAALGFAQADLKVSPDLKFEAASLKPAAPDQRGGGIRPAPGGERYVASNVTLKTMLMVAYRVRVEQIVGGPDWLDSARFDMNAKAEKPSNADELHAMLVNLLLERFDLKFHHDTKEMPRYTLTVAAGGPKMTAHQADNPGQIWIDARTEAILHVKMHATFCPMDYFAFQLGSRLDRPVVDLTGLKGGFDFDFAYTRQLPPEIPEGALVNGAPLDTSGPTVFQALKQQLGLELKAEKGPVSVIVIDSAKKLTEN